MATDITYIKTRWGMTYFTAVIDLYSLKILSLALSDNMKVDFCIGWRTLKYEWFFLRGYTSEAELRKSLAEFVEFFNKERIRQGLDYRTPDEVYEAGLFNGCNYTNEQAA